MLFLYFGPAARDHRVSGLLCRGPALYRLGVLQNRCHHPPPFCCNFEAPLRANPRPATHRSYSSGGVALPYVIPQSSRFPPSERTHVTSLQLANYGAAEHRTWTRWTVSRGRWRPRRQPRRPCRSPSCRSTRGRRPRTRCRPRRRGAGSRPAPRWLRGLRPRRPRRG